MTRSRHRRPAVATRSRSPRQQRRSRTCFRRLPGQRESGSRKRQRRGAEGDGPPGSRRSTHRAHVEAAARLPPAARALAPAVCSHAQRATWAAPPSAAATPSCPHHHPDDEEHDEDRDTGAATAVQAVQIHDRHRARIRSSPLARPTTAAPGTQLHTSGAQQVAAGPAGHVQATLRTVRANPQVSRPSWVDNPTPRRRPT